MCRVYLSNLLLRKTFKYIKKLNYVCYNVDSTIFLNLFLVKVGLFGIF